MHAFTLATSNLTLPCSTSSRIRLTLCCAATKSIAVMDEVRLLAIGAD